MVKNDHQHQLQHNLLAFKILKLKNDLNLFKKTYNRTKMYHDFETRINKINKKIPSKKNELVIINDPKL